MRNRRETMRIVSSTRGVPSALTLGVAVALSLVACQPRLPAHAPSFESEEPERCEVDEDDEAEEPSHVEPSHHAIQGVERAPLVHETPLDSEEPERCEVDDDDEDEGEEPEHHASAHREATPAHEPAHHETSAHEPAHEPAHREATPAHEPAHHETSAHEAKPVHEPAHHEATAHEPVHEPAHEPAHHEAMAHEPAHEPAHHEATAHEPAHHEATAHEPAHHEATAHEPVHEPAHHEAKSAPAEVATVITPQEKAERDRAMADATARLSTVRAATDGVARRAEKLRPELRALEAEVDRLEATLPGLESAAVAAQADRAAIDAALEGCDKRTTFAECRNACWTSLYAGDGKEEACVASRCSPIRHRECPDAEANDTRAKAQIEAYESAKKAFGEAERRLGAKRNAVLGPSNEILERIETLEAIVQKLESDPAFVRGYLSQAELLVAIPGGKFRMGSDEGGADERPMRDVSIVGFGLDRTEVTVDAYAACVNAGACTTPSTGGACNWGQNGKGKHPINCVDWSRATAYCAWVGKRLPTEEEWEYAARGTDGRIYPWGNEEPASQLCWKRTGTCAVGSFPAGASPFGLLDMAGNVWEWTSSGYSADYDKERLTDAFIDRGGSWYSDFSTYVRGAYRSKAGPMFHGNNVGFRCAR